jgi:hypothetical protein
MEDPYISPSWSGNMPTWMVERLVDHSLPTGYVDGHRRHFFKVQGSLTIVHVQVTHTHILWFQTWNHRCWFALSFSSCAH